MFRRNIYYLLKPVMPVQLRRAIRGVFARRRLRRSHAIWPILESAAARPPAWNGWPDGGEFACVLTHDVEGKGGLAKVRQLAELEMSLGFRSSFNFVPEGEYTVPDALRSWLTENGFEVGVHDLHHDGKLYKSREIFTASARRINGYLREWGAVGYRSGFMLHNYAWHHDLDVLYDATSFDIDPFEPQPDGVGTIFPFFVPRPRDEERKDQGSGIRDQGSEARDQGSELTPAFRNLTPESCLLTPEPARRAGYVELPYTLVQDSTLFLILGERTTHFWQKKLAWVAQQGGMALLNTHPDYMAFAGERIKPRRTFDVELYAGFLRHVRDGYQGRYVNLLPRQAAESAMPSGVVAASAITVPSRAVPTTARVTAPAKPLAGKRAAVLLYSYYPSDPRPRRAALAMVEAGMEVEFFCLRSEGQPAEERVDGLSVRRISQSKTRGSKFSYFLQYGQFLAKCFGLLAGRSLNRRYDIVHVHNMPDILVFAALPARLRGARVILDLHDPMPELMTAIYQFEPGHSLVRMLKLFEKWSIGFAHLALTPNRTFKDVFVSRGCPDDKMQIVMNSPEQVIFDPNRFPPDEYPFQRQGEFRIMHHGSIVHRHGIDCLVKAVASLRERITGIRLDIYGSHTPFLDEVMALAAELKAADIVHYHGSKPLPEIAAAIRECHLGVVPNRRSAFTETNFPTRLFEYLSMHRPVLAPSTQGIRDYFPDGDILYFNPDIDGDLAARLLWAYENPDQVRQITIRGSAIYRKHLWSEERRRLVEMTCGLLRKR